jgi:hypothetical protein
VFDSLIHTKVVVVLNWHADEAGDGVLCCFLQGFSTAPVLASGSSGCSCSFAGFAPAWGAAISED